MRIAWSVGDGHAPCLSSRDSQDSPEVCRGLVENDAREGHLGLILLGLGQFPAV